MAIIVNLSNEDVILNRGERICEIILVKMEEYEFIEAENLPGSE